MLNGTLNPICDIWYTFRWIFDCVLCVCFIKFIILFQFSSLNIKDQNRHKYRFWIYFHRQEKDTHCARKINSQAHKWLRKIDIHMNSIHLKELLFFFTLSIQSTLFQLPMPSSLASTRVRAKMVKMNLFVKFIHHRLELYWIKVRMNLTRIKKKYNKRTNEEKKSIRHQNWRMEKRRELSLKIKSHSLMY